MSPLTKQLHNNEKRCKMGFGEQFLTYTVEQQCSFLLVSFALPEFHTTYMTQGCQFSKWEKDTKLMKQIRK